VSTNNIKSILDPTDFSDASAGLDLYGNMIRESHHYDAFGGKTRFHARVLSIPIPMDSAGFRVDSAMGAPPAPGTAGSYLSKAIGYAFRARILDDPSPHWFIPDPCGTTEVLSSTDAQKLIMLHTKFIMAVTHVSEVPNMGDLVMVELKKDTFAYNLQLGEALYKIDSKIYQQSTLFGDSAGCGNKCPERIGPRVAPPSSAPGPAPVPNPPPSPRAAYEEEAPYIPSVPRASGAEPLAIQSMRSKGWTPLEDGSINLVGVRYKGLPRDYTSESGLDKFVDRLQSIWFEDGKWKVLSSLGSTVPGVGKRSKSYTEKWGLEKGARAIWGIGTLGSAPVLLPGHYPKAYKWRAHNGQYLTMAQASDIPHYRDFDFDEVVGNEAGRTVDSSHYGLQILSQDCATWKGKDKCTEKDMKKFAATHASAQASLTKYGGDTTIWKRSVGANIHASAKANTDPSPLKKPLGPNRELANSKTYPKEGPIVGTAPHDVHKNKPRGVRKAGDFKSMNHVATRVNGWSAGCQVFKNYADWRASIDIWSRSAQVYKQYKYPYTLFDEKDIAGGIPGLDEDATHFVGA